MRAGICFSRFSGHFAHSWRLPPAQALVGLGEFSDPEPLPSGPGLSPFARMALLLYDALR